MGAINSAAQVLGGVTVKQDSLGWDVGTILVITVLSIPVTAFVGYAGYLLFTGKSRSVSER